MNLELVEFFSMVNLLYATPIDNSLGSHNFLTEFQQQQHCECGEEYRKYTHGPHISPHTMVLSCKKKPDQWM